MSSHIKGLLITALGVLLVTPDSLFVRLIDAEPLATAFWRGLTAGALIFVVVLTTQGPRAFGAVLSAGRPAWIYMALLGSTAPAFVMAVTHTSVANVVFIFATIPIFAALFSRVFLGEPIEKRIVATMIVVLIGLGVIAYGSGASEIASWKGDVWALYIAIAYAGALTAVRRVKDMSMIPAVPFAYFGAAAVLFFFSDPFTAWAANWPLLLGHGLFIGAATCFLTLGPRYISSAEVGLLILLESVLAPILVWAALGEDPGRLALIGGAIVVGALLASNLAALRAQR